MAVFSWIPPWEGGRSSAFLGPKRMCKASLSIFWFLPIHRCVLTLYTQYFPEFCDKISQACYSGGIRTHVPCNSRAVSYQLDYRGCSVARGSLNPMLRTDVKREPFTVIGPMLRAIYSSPRWAKKNHSQFTMASSHQ